MSDFRSQRMPSPEGEGIAKRAWEAYTRALEPVTKAMGPLTEPLARGATFDLVGFWFVWHTCGGFEGLQSQLHMSRSAIYRRVSMFRRVFGAHPDAFRFPGVTIDLEATLSPADASPASAPDVAEP